MKRGDPMTDKNTDVSHELNILLRFRQSRDWSKFHDPKNLAISLALEASEVLEIFQWSKSNELPHEKRDALQDELADVYAYLLLLAHETNIDLGQAFYRKIKKNEEKYPVDLCKGSSKKYNE